MAEENASEDPRLEDLIEYVSTSAHPVNEDPEENIGVELPDPWETADADGSWKDVTGVTEA